MATPTVPALIAPVARAVPALRNPSGACKFVLLAPPYRNCKHLAISREQLTFPAYDVQVSHQSTELRATLGDAGHRLTGPRVAVWEVISHSDDHLTAEEIADQVQVSDPSVNLSSIYRSLALFSNLGLVRESSLGSGEAAHWEVAHPDEQFHMRCTSCGRVEHHTGDIVDQVRTHLSDSHGFAANNIELLVTGLCSDCLALQTGADSGPHGVPTT
jgi:Fur family ferric uptake transcriptional regulator